MLHIYKKILIVLALLLFALFILIADKTASSSAWSVVGSVNISDGIVYSPGMVMDSQGNIYAMYLSEAQSQFVIKKWNGSSWNLFSTFAGASTAKIVIDRYDVPYLLTADTEMGDKISIYKWDGEGWGVIGTRGFTPGMSFDLGLVFDSNNTPIVSFLNVENSYLVSAMKFENDTWSYVGLQYINDNIASHLSMVIDINNNIYLAYSDGEAENKATVKKWNGSQWSEVGGYGISAGDVRNLVIALDKNYAPYVAYRDGSTDSYKLTVLKWDGAIWQSLGGVGISAGNAHYPSVVFDSSNNLYVAYRDSSFDNKVAVIKWDGDVWQTVGSNGVSEGQASNINLLINSNDILYLSYTDVYNNTGMTVLKYANIVTLPTISTISASNITLTDATLSGEIANIGGENNTERGFEYGTSISYGANITQEGSFEAGQYSLVASNLTCGTMYHFRALSSNSSGYGYGQDSTLRTGDCPPSAAVIIPLFVPVAKNQLNTDLSPTDTIQNNKSENADILPLNSFNKNINIGSHDQSARDLQIFLNSQGFMISKNGLGSPGKETEFFGNLTKSALIKFQEAHADEILKPLGLSKGTGVLGPRTRVVINRLLENK